MLHLALVVALSPAPQGAVWVVDANAGPGHDFVTIHEAVQAAADGDTLLVRSGGYGPFPIAGKSLSVVADAGAQVDVNTFSFSGLAMTVVGTSAGSTTVVRGIDFVAGGVAPNAFAYFCVSLADCAGTVLFEECEFNLGPAAPVLIEDCTDVVLEGCTAIGTTGYSSTSAPLPSSPGLRATGSRVTIHGGSYTGGNGKGASWPFHSTPGMAGIHLVSGELYLGQCSAVGGGGGRGIFMGSCPGVPPDGGPGLWAENGVVRTLDANLVGGPKGTPQLGCPDASDGPPYTLGSATLIQLSGMPSGLASNSPVREGQTLTMRLTTTPGQSLTALLLAGQATAPAFAAQLAGVSLLGGPTRRIELGSVDPLTGIVTIPIVVPELGAGVLAAPWIFQAFVCGGGTCTAGAATHTVWLDASL